MKVATFPLSIASSVRKGKKQTHAKRKQIMSRHSKEAKIVLKTLSGEEKEAININYPIRERRNEIVRLLRNRGVKIRVIKEISGISRATISRIGKEIIPNLEYRENSILEDIKAILSSIEERLSMINLKEVKHSKDKPIS
jgi:uncharacterized membrane protein